MRHQASGDDVNLSLHSAQCSLRLQYQNLFLLSRNLDVHESFMQIKQGYYAFTFLTTAAGWGCHTVVVSSPALQTAG
jgi:hypothetical protein